LLEDALVPAGLFLALAHPAIFLALFVLAALGALFLLHWLLRGLTALVARLRSA
jgi:hypothetical protein